MATPFPASNINWRDVQSSNVLALGWDNANHLYVRFVGGGEYLYEGVSRQRAVAMARAKSVGKYLNQKIKPRYKAVKLT